MSQWARVQQNTTVLDQMRQLYPPHFTVEVRYYLCEWIEAQQWDRISENDLQHAPAAVKLLTEMLDLLQKKIKELMGNEHFIIRYNLEDCYHKIQNLVDTNPFDMIQTIKTCLANEKLLLDQLETEPQQDEVNDTHEEDEQTINDRIIMDEIQNLFTKTKNTETDLKHLQQKQETFIIQFSDGQRITGLVHQLSQQPQSAQRIQKEKEFKAQKDKIDILLTTLAHDLFLLRIELSKKYEQTILSLQKVQQQILDNKLISWKRQQQLAGNGLVVASSGLETLQKWCDDLADLIWQNRQQIKKSTQLQQQLPIKVPDSNEDLLPKLNETITTLLSSLVTSTFIVVQQPPQVLKKDARFSASVSLLVGGKLNIHMNPPHVKATIISEHQASDLLKLQSDCKVQEMTSGEILNNSGLMEYQAKTGHLGITFRNMQLKKIKRAEKRGSEAVTDEKFCILFQSKFSVGGSELIYQVWTLSLPVVVTVHGNQECNASATVLWDNGFAEPGRLSFEVPDSVEWNSLADQLNTKFKFHTGKGLTKTNLDYLASKLFGKKDPSTCKVSWAQFSKVCTLIICVSFVKTTI
uniref:STAT transcription factor protein interaction domain-containing protein n=2 Tax=Arion vulgaris TaxID=1028688 RepID=A0A0B7B2F6_9EUPU